MIELVLLGPCPKASEVVPISVPAQPQEVYIVPVGLLSNSAILPCHFLCQKLLCHLQVQDILPY